MVLVFLSRSRFFRGIVPDMIQAGNIALMDAARSFDPDRGVKFTTYACRAIRSNINAVVAEQPVLGPGKRTEGSAVWAKQAATRIRSLNHEIKPDSDLTVENTLSSSAASPEQILLAKEYQEKIASEIQQVISRVEKLKPARFRMFVRRYGLDNGLNVRTFDQIGREARLTKQAAQHKITSIWKKVGQGRDEDWLIDRFEKLQLLSEVSGCIVRFQPETNA